MSQPNYSAGRRSQFDPTGGVDLENPQTVEAAVRDILDRKYAGRYDVDLLHTAMDHAVQAYRGAYPGLLRCDTLYHDLRHCLEVALTMARLLDGYAVHHAPGSAAGIDADHALLGILLALFHDIGLLRRDTEAPLWGAVLTPIHEERGVEFMQAYLPGTTLGALVGESRLIMATKLVYTMPDEWPMPERRLASLLATADLVSQVSDRCYLEKCRDFLFLEFSAFGLAGRPDSAYPDQRTLLEKTPEFIERYVHQRLDGEFMGMRRYLRAHAAGADPWSEGIERNLAYLKTLLDGNCLERLRRVPKPYIGDATTASGG